MEQAAGLQEARSSKWLETLLPQGAETAALPVFRDEGKAQQAILVKTIGTRFKEARELCNMSQQDAAARLGYSNPSKLAKIEGATDTNSVPLHLIPKVALLYDVSIDYLFGQTDDWEPDIQRDTTQWLLKAWEQARLRDLQALEGLHRRVCALVRTFDSLVVSVGEVSTALCIVRDRNPEFDELIAGNRLLSSIERQADTAQKAEGIMRRFRCELVGKQTIE